MQKIEYTKMFKLEDTHFWFVGKRYFVDSILSKHKRGIKNILDLGSGTGGMTKHLEKYGNVIGIESYNYAVKLAKSRRLTIKNGDLNTFKVKNSSFDLVTIFDVLYHQNIKNEGVILSRAHKALKKNGFLLITDSALQILTSQHDVVTQGKRRYTLQEMKRMVEEQNFRVVKASYIYFSLFLFVFFKRLVLDKIANESTSDVKPIHLLINNLFLAILNMESQIIKYASLPIGSSVILLAIKE